MAIGSLHVGAPGRSLHIKHNGIRAWNYWTRWQRDNHKKGQHRRGQRMAAWLLKDIKKKLPACSALVYQPSLFNYKFLNSQGGPVCTNVLPLLLDSSYCNFKWKSIPHTQTLQAQSWTVWFVSFTVVLCFLNMELAATIRKSCCLGKPLRSHKSS